MASDTSPERVMVPILQAVQQTDGQAGPGDLAKILLGRKSKRLARLDFDHLPQFGILAELDRGTVIEHIDDLIQRGCITVGSLIFFPKLRLTDTGEQRLQTLAEAEIEEDLLTEPIAVPESGELFDEKSFWRRFYRDLRNARERVIIMSAFVSETRHSNDLFITFQALLARGVKVTVCTRPLDEQDPGTDRLIELLKGMGVEFAERSRMHHKIAIVDNAIAWEGSLNILSHWGSGEHMRRFEDEGVVGEILRGVGV